MDAYDVEPVFQQALDRLTLLADVSTALASTLDGPEGVRRVCRIIAHRLGASCTVDLLTDHRELERLCVSHQGADRPVAHDLYSRRPPPHDPEDPLARVFNGAGPLLLDAAPRKPEAGDLLDPGTTTGFAQPDAASAVIAPVRARREVLGALTLTRGSDRPALDVNDLALVEDLAHRIGLAVDNARLHRETERIAERLQRSLLPDLPDITPFTIAARYTPAHATAQVGGDWYDAFHLPGGDHALIIGDVTGHDLKAAVTMSQLRNMIRGIACDRQEPPEKILHRLDLAQHTLYPGATATCIFATFHTRDNGPWDLHYAAAGHPPPLLITHDGDTRYLEGGRSLLLGVAPTLPRTSAVEPLPPGSTLLLYTDGLVERRGEDLGNGMTRLRQHAAALARERPDTLLDELLTGLAPDPTDDVALLAVRTPPTTNHHT
ncbi:PP2C family protein-serine/threonine phosphatase [Streptomyces sp. NPDC012825]|uniref:PP2C family protein-serine/threonine phosphatase n=1 Tax=Streptomyces sp. NPDC012825 TaxID=3364851 RepID=UPI003689FD8C